MLSLDSKLKMIKLPLLSIPVSSLTRRCQPPWLSMESSLVHVLIVLKLEQSPSSIKPPSPAIVCVTLSTCGARHLKSSFPTAPVDVTPPSVNPEKKQLSSMENANACATPSNLLIVPKDSFLRHAMIQSVMDVVANVRKIVAMQNATIPLATQMEFVK